MALKTLIFGTDDLYPVLKPYYEQEVQRGNLEIAAYAVFENGTINLVDATSKRGDPDDSPTFELAIISSWKNFYDRMKFLEAQGFPRSRIIDGGVFFGTYELDFPSLLKDGIAYYRLEKNYLCDSSPAYGTIGTIYPRIYVNMNKTLIVKMESKGYINSAIIDGVGLISIGKFSSISWNQLFKLNVNSNHNYRRIFTAGPDFFGWQPPAGFSPPKGTCKILIGNDVWIGRSCILKCANPDKPLVIGDGAVIASDSVVVKSVPPYAIVGGNPAQIIKYRFPPDVIESMLRIKWWDWDIDKIHDNFKYFNDIEKFISLHDRS